MILDSIVNINQYHKLHPGFASAFEFIQKNDLNTITTGSHEIIDGKMFVNASIVPGKGITNAKLETHKRFYDIQCGVSGVDNIGWKPLCKCLSPDGDYNIKNDVCFFSDLPETWFGLSPGTFAIFSPTDAHAPLAVNGMLHKVVIKVLVDW